MKGINMNYVVYADGRQILEVCESTQEFKTFVKEFVKEYNETITDKEVQPIKITSCNTGALISLLKDNFSFSVELR